MADNSKAKEKDPEEVARWAKEKAERKKKFEEERAKLLAAGGGAQKKQSKAEKRELQEQQKAAKGIIPTPKQPKQKAQQSSNAQQPPKPPTQGTKAPGSGNRSPATPSQNNNITGEKVPSSIPGDRPRRQSNRQLNRGVLSLFSHLNGPRSAQGVETAPLGKKSEIHPAIVTLGLKYSQRIITGANSRCVAMLIAFKDVIKDYKTPEKTSIARDLDRFLKPLIQHLISSRPHSITMGNAIKFLRNAITTLPPDISEVDAKAELCESIDMYINSNVTLAQEVIVRHAIEKISDGDTVLTFGRSQVVEQSLLAAHEKGIRFKVVVVSCRPENEGLLLVKTLASAGLECVYILLSSLSYMMGSANKVMLGASALFSNGAALSRAGTALVAMMAKAYNKPVLFLAETHKFTDKVQVNSIVSNELSDPEKLLLPKNFDVDLKTKNAVTDVSESEKIEMLNLLYDLTPQEYITMLITEFGMLPASSVPAIVREKGFDAKV